MNAAGPRSREQVFAVLETVADPEVPVISVVELGIVRNASVAADGAVSVVITPTYSGCPAMFEIEQDIVRALTEAGAPRVDVSTVLAPAWTTDWIGEGAREKLRRYGIAPPGRTQGRAAGQGLVTLVRAPQDVQDVQDVQAVACPRCGSTHTELKSAFGSTACKAIHVCLDCREPFDEFKPL